jgi:hypothetical protein
VIARTEVIRAHAEGQLDALEELGVEELGVEVEWTVTEDSRLCPLCAALKGVVLTLDEAKGLLPRHPNCRCAFIPANVGEDEEGQLRSKSAIEKAIDKSIQAESPKRPLEEQRERSRWPGADTKIAKTRPEGIV